VRAQGPGGLVELITLVVGGRIVTLAVAQAGFERQLGLAPQPELGVDQFSVDDVLLGLDIAADAVQVVELGQRLVGLHPHRARQALQRFPVEGQLHAIGIVVQRLVVDVAVEPEVQAAVHPLAAVGLVDAADQRGDRDGVRSAQIGRQLLLVSDAVEVGFIAERLHHAQVPGAGLGGRGAGDHRRDACGCERGPQRGQPPGSRAAIGHGSTELGHVGGSLGVPAFGAQKRAGPVD